MIEDIAIQIRHKLNERRKYKIKDIIFTPNTSIDDIYDLMKKMALGNHDEIAAIRRIHKWGSKSVHKGQVVPISLIWYSLFFVCNRLPSIFGDASKISKNIHLALSKRRA